MKTSSRALILAVGFALALALPVSAQVKQALDSDRIKGTIERLESTELKSKSASVQEVYKVSLLRLYNQYISALRQDIADLKLIKSTVGEEDASAPDSISVKLRGLEAELDATAEKIRTLKGDIQVNASAQSPAVESESSASQSDVKEEQRQAERPSRPVQSVPAMTLASNRQPATPRATAGGVSDSLPEYNVRARSSAVSGCTTIEIISPPGDTYTTPTLQKLDLKIRVDPADCTKKLFVKVENPPETVEQRTLDVDKDSGIAKASGLKLKKGTNTISVWDDDERSGSPKDYLTVSCEGDDCGKGAASETADDKPVAPTTDSLYTRAIIGFEQAGVSSAPSESRPFVDYFFSAPLAYKRNGDKDRKIIDDDKLFPAFSIWGNLSLKSVPQQISAFRTLGNNFFGPVNDNKVNDLVQGFDFMVGPEFRLYGTPVTHFGLIPGIRQRTSINFIMGFGAISPLTLNDSARIFNVPDTANPQYDAFIEEFPQAKGKKYIAYVAPERDRFLRQYFGGIRFKTFFLERKENKDTKELEDSLINRFPAIFDVTFGQSDAVTGGKLHKFVLGFDGVYPLPFKSGRFLYLYGTAKLKVGGGKLIRTPFALSNPGSDIQLTNNDLVITTRQTNRDFYRLGIGVNLAELFNSPEPEKKEEKKEDKKDDDDDDQ